MPNSFVRCTTDFIKSNIAIVDESTNDQDDVKQSTEVFLLLWISLSIRNGDIFVPTIHHGTLQWDLNTELMMELQSLLYYQGKW